jgi:Putative metal-binding motif
MTRKRELWWTGRGVVVGALAAATMAVGGSPDCDDTDSAVNPGAAEVPDGKDNDCDGLVDEAA